MIKRIFTLVAAIALLAACETASTTDSSATGSTTSAATSGTSTASSTTAATTSDEAADPAEVMKKEFTKVGTTVLFDFDSSQLSDYARRVLDRQAAF